MKKPIHLYIFAALSCISVALRLWSVFFSTFDESAMRDTFEKSGVTNVDEVVGSLRSVVEFNTNLINKSLTVLLFVLLIATIVFLFQKKNEQASYAYMAYLFGTLLSSTHVYLWNKELLNYLLNIALFALFFGLTIFFLLHKPKDKPSMAQNATDI